MSRPPKDVDRCEFVYEDGRRCRRLRLQPDIVYCFNHWQRQQQQESAARIGEEIVAADDPLCSQESIHKALGNVFRFCARNLISPRSAAVLGYVGQLMLTSAPSIERQLQSSVQTLLLMSKVKQLADKSNSDERIYKLALDQFELSRRVFEQYNALNSMSAEDRERFLKFVATLVSKKEGEPAANPESKMPG